MDATSPLIADTLSCTAAVDRAISFNETAISFNALRGSMIQPNTSIAMVKATRSASAVPSPIHNSLQCINCLLVHFDFTNALWRLLDRHRLACASRLKFQLEKAPVQRASPDATFKALQPAFRIRLAPQHFPGFQNVIHHHL